MRTTSPLLVRPTADRQGTLSVLGSCGYSAGYDDGGLVDAVGADHGGFGGRSVDDRLYPGP